MKQLVRKNGHDPEATTMYLPPRRTYPWPRRRALFGLILSVGSGLAALVAFELPVVELPNGACPACVQHTYTAWDVYGNVDRLWSQPAPLTPIVFGALIVQCLVAIGAYLLLVRGIAWLSYLHIAVAFGSSLITLGWLYLVATSAYILLLHGLLPGGTGPINLGGSLVALTLFLAPIGALILLRTRRDPEERAARSQYHPKVQSRT